MSSPSRPAGPLFHGSLNRVHFSVTDSPPRRSLRQSAPSSPYTPDGGSSSQTTGLTPLVQRHLGIVSLSSSPERGFQGPSPMEVTTSSPLRKRYTHPEDDSAGPSDLATGASPKKQRTPERLKAEEVNSASSHPRFSSKKGPEDLFPELAETPAKKCHILTEHLNRLTQREHFVHSEAAALLSELDTAVFSFRKYNKEQAPLSLYEPSFLLRLCELRPLLEQPLVNDRDKRDALRTWQTVFNTARTQMTDDQKEHLFDSMKQHLILTNPIYRPLMELRKNYFLPLDPTPGMREYSNEELLRHAIDRARADLANPPPGIPLSTIQQVHELATRMLDQTLHGIHVPVDRLFHFTKKPKQVVRIFDEDLQVKHELLYKGAFLSTESSSSFGNYGVTASFGAAAARLSEKDRIERRSMKGESGALWIGVGKSVPVLNDRVIVHPDADRDLLREELKFSGYPATEIVDLEVQHLFTTYIRELDRFVPVPFRTNPSLIQAWDLPPEPDF